MTLVQPSPQLAGVDVLDVVMMHAESLSDFSVSQLPAKSPNLADILDGQLCCPIVLAPRSAIAPLPVAINVVLGFAPDPQVVGIATQPVVAGMQNAVRRPFAIPQKDDEPMGADFLPAKNEVPISQLDLFAGVLPAPSKSGVMGVGGAFLVDALPEPISRFQRVRFGHRESLHKSGSLNTNLTTTETII